jgi:hypothetical protein
VFYSYIMDNIESQKQLDKIKIAGQHATQEALSLGRREYQAAQERRAQINLASGSKDIGNETARTASPINVPEG